MILIPQYLYFRPAPGQPAVQPASQAAKRSARQQAPDQPVVHLATQATSRSASQNVCAQIT